jgi:hypothetical protein
VAVPSLLVLESIFLGHAIGIERQEMVSMEVEDAILSIQIQEGATDARIGQEVVEALHVRVVLQLLFVQLKRGDYTIVSIRTRRRRRRRRRSRQRRRGRRQQSGQTRNL